MEHLNEDIVMKTLAVPSVSGKEHMMRDYLIAFADEHGKS